jgi:hypothetical protein
MPVTEALEKISDPNRGRIVAGEVSVDDEFYRLYVGYGGRSPGSKNRYTIFLPDLNEWGDIARTAVYNTTDPTLQRGRPEATLYNAQRGWGNWHVASNGEQTDGIGATLLALDGLVLRSADGTILNEVEHFKIAQRAYHHEGPKNDNTPRITAAIKRTAESNTIFMGRIFCLPDSPKTAQRLRWILGANDEDFPLEPGFGYLQSTYDGKGGVGTNFEDPWMMQFGKTLEDGMDIIWDKWDPNTRANLIGKEINKKTGEIRYVTKSIHPEKPAA